jgi:hypothetical protein
LSGRELSIGVSAEDSQLPIGEAIEKHLTIKQATPIGGDPSRILET